MRFASFMEYFWWRAACPLPDGRFNCWLGGKPYNWTGRLSLPWLLITHASMRNDYARRLAGAWLKTSAVLSIVLFPVGVLIWLGGGRRHPFFPKTYEVPSHG